MSALRPLLALAAATAIAFGTVGVASGPALGAAPAVRADLPGAALRSADLPGLGLPGADLPSDAQLRAALLTVDDVGSLFTEVPIDEEASPDEEEQPPVSDCNELVELILNMGAQQGSAEHRESVELTGPDDNPMLTETLVTEDSTQLTEDFDRATEAFESCDSFTVGEGFGATTFDVTDIELGDRPEAPAVRIQGTVFGVQLTGYIGIERFGPVAMGYTYFETAEAGPTEPGQGAIGKEAASQHYGTAVAKAERVLGTQAGSTAAEIGSGTAA